MQHSISLLGQIKQPGDVFGVIFLLKNTWWYTQKQAGCDGMQDAVVAMLVQCIFNFK